MNCKSNHRDALFVAVVAAGVGIFASEALRRLFTTTSEDGGKQLPPVEKGVFGRALREAEFDLRPGYTNCNCGSYGHVPRRILMERLRIMKERESDQDGWFRYKEAILHKEALEAVAEFVGADPENIVFVENASTGTNTALRSIEFSPGDKILTTSHTYGAVLKNVQVVHEDIPGVEEVRLNLRIPLWKDEDVVSQFESIIRETPGIKVAIIDAITSPTAVRMPLKPLIELCHQNGILVIVDGAHAPGHIPLKLEELGADYFTGNIHKWCFAARGCAVLWVHPKHHSQTDPILVSHCHMKEKLTERFQPIATRDSSSYWSVAEALKFHHSLGGLDSFGERNAALVTRAAEMLAEAWGTDVFPVARHLRAPFMALTRLPPAFRDSMPHDEGSSDRIMRMLHDQNLTVCIFFIHEDFWCRISGHVWNDEGEYVVVRDRVLALARELPSLIPSKDV